MPKQAGRATLFAALAVPFVMVVAPLTASADAPGDFTITHYESTGAFATEAGAGAMSVSSLAGIGSWHHGHRDGVAKTTEAAPVAVERVDDVNVVGDVTVIGDTYHGHADDVNIVGDVTVVDDVVLVEEAEEAEAIEVEEAEVEEVEVEEVEVVEETEDVAVENDGWGGDLTFASYSESAAYAGPDGAWAESLETGAVTVDGWRSDGGGTGAYYSDSAAGAGPDGAFSASLETAAGTTGGHHGHHGGTFAGYDYEAAGASSDGAIAVNVSSGAGTIG